MSTSHWDCHICGSSMDFGVSECPNPNCSDEAAWRERAARICDARALSLAENGQVLAANEAQKCAAAIRRRAA
jgi:hypothetical protein